jgi:hypothetical protein
MNVKSRSGCNRHVDTHRVVRIRLAPSDCTHRVVTVVRMAPLAIWHGITPADRQQLVTLLLSPLQWVETVDAPETRTRSRGIHSSLRETESRSIREQRRAKAVIPRGAKGSRGIHSSLRETESRSIREQRRAKAVIPRGAKRSRGIHSSGRCRTLRKSHDRRRRPCRPGCER